MFIAIHHNIHNSEKFQQSAEAVFPLPKELYVHQYFPAPDLRKAACLYEAPSIDVLRDYLDEKLREASTQEYFPVHDGEAIGLPNSAKAESAN